MVIYGVHGCFYRDVQKHTIHKGMAKTKIQCCLNTIETLKKTKIGRWNPKRNINWLQISKLETDLPT